MADIPTREAILEFVNAQNGKVGKREIARAFHIKGADRIGLKQLLREMAAEGLLEGARKSGMRLPGELPPVCVVRVTGQTKSGRLIAHAIQEGTLLDGPDHAIIYIDEKPPRGRIRVRSPALLPGDTALARLTDKSRDTQDGDGASRPVYQARIIRQLNESGGTVIGVMREHADGWWLEPVDRRERYGYKIPDAHTAANGDVVVGEKIAARRSGPKMAKVIENIGKSDAPNVFSLISIAEQGLPTHFPDTVLGEAAAVEEADFTGREDLTGLPFVTIDPADARDHDDAVYAEADTDPDNAGGHIVWVAIADVAAYVTPGSAMDSEAAKRGNSVYMPDRVVPMLPERLSTDLCSLREGETRPCMALRMVIGADGRKKTHSFHRAMMRSAARLSYGQAQTAFDSFDAGNEAATPDVADAILPILQDLWRAYQCMAEARDARAPLLINRPERRIELNEKGKITRIYTPPQLEANRLIEEMMVTANVCAAQTLEKHKCPLIYRIHDSPDPERVRALSDFIRPLGVRLNLGENLLPRLFNNVMQRAEASGHHPTISEAVLRTQAQAVYHTQNIGHFGLNLGRYAHFTSPIRRYADLTVHRALILALKLGPKPSHDGQPDGEQARLQNIAEAVSATERRAMLAERTAADRYLSAYMAKRQGERFTGRISGLSRAGLFVKLDDSGANGLVPMAQLGAERFFVDDDKMSLTGGTTGLTFRLGDEVEICLEEAMPIQGGLLFSLVDGGTIDRSGGGKRRTSGHPRSRRAALKPGRKKGRRR